MRGLAVTLVAGLVCGLSGCRHKTQLAPLPPVMAPVDLVDVPPLANPPVLEVSPVRLPPPPTAAAAAKPKKERKRAPKVAQAPVAAPPVQTAAATTEPSPETAAIGALTAGGEATPETTQEASDLIASIEKRLNALPAASTEDQKAQINKVRNFWKDAQQALKSGDAEGAKTLATKAKLLLDDLEK
jgi:hypothetical protein